MRARTLATLFAIVICAVTVSLDLLAQQPPEPISSSTIPKFVEPLPLLSVGGGTIQTVAFPAASSETVLRMCEFKANVLPHTFTPENGAYSGTWVWGYRVGTCPDPNAPVDTYIGPVFVTKREVPTKVRFVNDLPLNPQVNWHDWTDQTLHWADPFNHEENMCAHMPMNGGWCFSHYTGPVPTVPHLHGAETPAVLDGSPDSWFTSDGVYHGHAYYTDPNSTVNPNEAVYRYLNTQEAAPIWFHDHSLGNTRTNVYSGLAGAYLITDPKLKLPAGLHPAGLQQILGGKVDYTIPLVIQDRMFDANGQLFFPNEGNNPTVHPFWGPEFIGDAILVNGKTWPVLNVEARRYRFLIINGSNARSYSLWFENDDRQGPAIWQIATDGGYLDFPARIDPNSRRGPSKLVIMPGERADIIVDFSRFRGKSLILRNDARAPYPAGDEVTDETSQILKVVVNKKAVLDTSYNPEIPFPLRWNQPIVRLANPITGTIPFAVGQTIAKTRQLTLNEVVSPDDEPLEVLVNNTSWDGMLPADTHGMHHPRPDFTASELNGITNYLSEIPDEGTTEVWEIVNLTMDAHPIHTHLTQFQLLNRQNFDTMKYSEVYEGSFPATANLKDPGNNHPYTIADPMTGQPYPGGMFIPGFGPPLNYKPSHASGHKYGGNPDVTPFLKGRPQPPADNEAGWKDTIMVSPGMVTRIVVRYAPTWKAINDPNLFYPFEPNAAGYNYVWHCHIIDHEDNEMMRPYMVNPKPNVQRTYVRGTDY